MKTVSNPTTALVFAVLIQVATSVGGSVAVDDDFDDNSLNTALWQTNTDPPGSNVTEHNQRIEIVDRGYLFTQPQFDPLTSGHVRVAAVVTINATLDNAALITRFDGTIGGSGSYYNPSTGIVFSINGSDDRILVTELPANTILGSQALEVNPGDSFSVVVIDTGSSIWFKVTEIGGDGSAAGINASSSANSPTNFVGFFNRESPSGGTGKTAYYDDVSITTLETDTFGSDGSTFEIDFVTVGDPGNPADSGTTGSYHSPHGGVASDYRIARTAVTEQMIDTANSDAGLSITHEGRGANRPAASVTWNEMARFVNWLNTSKGFIPAYKFENQPGDPGYDSLANIQLWESGDPGYDAANPFRNSGAAYFLPSEDEFYKAAFYSGNGSIYFDYATCEDTIPTPTASGTDGGSVVYQSAGGAPTDVDQAGGPGPYGTIGQTGNLWEFTESNGDGSNDDPTESRIMRGGNWTNDVSYIRASSRIAYPPTHEDWAIGFRVASKPLSPEIAVEQPAGLALTDGLSTIDFGTEASGSATPAKVFRVVNDGDGDLAELAILIDGADASDFSVAVAPASIVFHASHTEFSIEFGPTGGTSTRAATLHITSNDEDESPFDIDLTGQGLSRNEDGDGDGLNDAAEFKLAGLGFDWQSTQTALVDELMGNSHLAGLYTESEILNVHVDAPLIEIIDGTLRLDLQLMKSDDLEIWAPLGDPAQWTEPAVGKRFFRLFFDDAP